jgi:hypothetical protein
MRILTHLLEQVPDEALQEGILFHLPRSLSPPMRHTSLHLNTSSAEFHLNSHVFSPRR